MNNDNAPRLSQAEQDLYTITIPQPDWNQWKSVSRTLLWKAVALLCDIAPNSLESSFYPGKLDTIFNKTTPKFTSLLKRAENHVGTDLLKPVFLNEECLQDSEVELSTFATWAKSTGHKLPAEFPWQPEEMPLKKLDWPWGKYETDLLTKLALAVDHFWKDYDPNKSTPPKQWDVVDWLLTHGVPSKNMAEAIATILRADGLPTRSKRK